MTKLTIINLVLVVVSIGKQWVDSQNITKSPGMLSEMLPGMLLETPPKRRHYLRRRGFSDPARNYEVPEEEELLLKNHDVKQRPLSDTTVYTQHMKFEDEYWTSVRAIDKNWATGAAAINAVEYEIEGDGLITLQKDVEILLNFIHYILVDGTIPNICLRFNEGTHNAKMVALKLCLYVHGPDGNVQQFQKVINRKFAPNTLVRIKPAGDGNILQKLRRSLKKKTNNQGNDVTPVPKPTVGVTVLTRGMLSFILYFCEGSREPNNPKNVANLFYSNSISKSQERV